MYSDSILRRDKDGKLFRVTFFGHWSDIQAEDGEKDCVKYYWTDAQGRSLMIGNQSGHSYTVLPRDQ